MNFTEYQQAAARTEKQLATPVERLVHHALGLSTEVGEINTEIKRVAIYEKPLTKEIIDHIAEEIGDVLWYLSGAASAIGKDLGVIAAQNIEKLRTRFPDKFTTTAAEARADKGGVAARDDRATASL